MPIYIAPYIFEYFALKEDKINLKIFKSPANQYQTKHQTAK